MRKISLGAVALAVLLILAYGGFWFYTAGQIRQNIEPFAEARRSEGYIIRWDDYRVGGFPLSFRVQFDNLFVAAPNPLPSEISGPDIVFSAAPWNLQRWSFSAPIGARLEILLISAGFDAASLKGLLTLPVYPEGALDIEASNLTGRGGAEGISVTTARLALSQPPTPPATERDAFLFASFKLSGLTLARDVPPLGPTIAEISANVAIEGAYSPGPVAQALGDWRDHGGTIELQQGHLQWDKLGADADGTLALDQDLQPLAAFSARVRGADELVDAAVASGSMRAQDAGIAKMLLGLIGTASADGQKEVKVPISAQNGKILLGPARVANLPHIDWR
jgi:hypothetical protein